MGGIRSVGAIRKVIFAFLAGVVLSFCWVAGKPLDLYDSLDLKQGSFYGRWFLAAVLAAILIYFLWESWERLEAYLNMRRHEEERDIRLRAPVCAALMLLCWLPALFSLFPGAFSYDALNEWQQVQSGIITAHHPVLHVLALGGAVEGFHALTGSYNAGIAVYTAVQMLLLAWLLARSIAKMEQLGLQKGVCLFALLFFCLSPVIQLFSISATKDIIFSAAELLFLFHLVFFYCRREAFWASRREQAEFALAAFFTAILRNNGIYIVLAGLALMLLVGKSRKKLTVLGGVILLPYLLYTGPCYALLHVQEAGKEEMLSVPLQQMARVYRYDRESLAEEEIDTLLTFVSLESLEAYRATVSDFVKKDFNGEAYRERRIDFWKLWAKWGREHPLTYVNSFLINTVDLWYPRAVVDGYRHADGRSSYFDYQVDEPGTEIVLLKGMHRYYDGISHDADVQKRPFVFLVLSPGTYLFFFLLLLFYLWRGRRYRLLASLAVLAVHFATVLLGPAALVRYVLIFYYAFPLFVGIALNGKRLEEM